MKIGDRFSSWEDFFYFLKEYEDRVYSNYYVRDSKTLEAYTKRLKNPKVHFNPELKYYYAFINCVKGGRNFIPRSKSIRKSRTGRIGCTAFIYLSTSQCRQYLVISKMNESHSHPVSQSLYKASAQQRLNIDESILRKYSNALVCHANKKVVQSKIFEETGKFLTLKDLTNMRSRVSKEAKKNLSQLTPGSSFSEDPNNVGQNPNHSGQDPNMTDFNEDLTDNTGENMNTIANFGQNNGFKHDPANNSVDSNIIIIDPNTMVIDDTNNSVANLITIDSNNTDIVENSGLCEEFMIVSNETTTTESPPESLQKTIIESVNLLQDVYKCEVYLFADYKRSPAAIFFQDQEMKSMFCAYPEIIFVDSISNILDNNAKTYLIVVEDSNGRGVIVAVGILFNEHQETLDWFFRKFKETNLNSEDINVIMTDKDCNVRNSLRNLFPQASLQICLFHTLQLFNHEISPNKMGITPEQTKLTKTYLRQLANCTTETRYCQLYSDMVSYIPDVVCEYFNRNWETIREEWAVYAISRKRGFMNKTNNKVKTLNKFLRSVIQTQSCLQDFIKYFFVSLNSNRTNNMVVSSRKLYSVTCDSLREKLEDCPERDYENLLTPFAFGKLKPNFEQTRAYNFEVIDEMYYSCHTDEGQVKLSTLSCNCSFFSSMGLPCHHIFSLRQCLELSVFDENLVLPRWTKEYTLTIHNKTSSTSDDFASSTNQAISNRGISNRDISNRDRVSHRNISNRDISNQKMSHRKNTSNQDISDQDMMSNEDDILNEDFQSISSQEDCQESNEDEVSDQTFSHSFNSPIKEIYPSHQSSSVIETSFSSNQHQQSPSVPETPYLSRHQQSPSASETLHPSHQQSDSTFSPANLQESSQSTDTGRGFRILRGSNVRGSNTRPSIVRESNSGPSILRSANQVLTSNIKSMNPVRITNVGPSNQVGTSNFRPSTNQGLSELRPSPNKGISSNFRPSNQGGTSNLGPSTNQGLSNLKRLSPNQGLPTSLENSSTDLVDDQDDEVDDRNSNSTEIVLNGHGFRILRRRVLCKSEKMKRMSEQCAILCDIGSDVKSSVVFEKRMKLLKYLERIWENNQDEKINSVIDMDMYQ